MDGLNCSNILIKIENGKRFNQYHLFIKDVAHTFFSINKLKNEAVWQTVFVNSAYRNKNIGKMLVIKAIEEMKRIKISSIFTILTPDERPPNYNFGDKSNNEPISQSKEEYNLQFDKLAKFCSQLGFQFVSTNFLNGKKIGSMRLIL